MDRIRWDAYDSCRRVFKKLKNKLRFNFKWCVTGDIAAVTYGSTRQVSSLSIFVDPKHYVYASKKIDLLKKQSCIDINIDIFDFIISRKIKEEYDRERSAAGSDVPCVSVEAIVALSLSRGMIGFCDVVEIIQGECTINWNTVEWFSKHLGIRRQLINECVSIEKMFGKYSDRTSIEYAQ